MPFDQLRATTETDFIAALESIYEHSPWIAARAFRQRPIGGFPSLAALKHTLVTVVADASEDEQLGLIRAHPELAGKAMVNRTLTAESTGEQQLAGLTHCTPDEFAQLQTLNQAYNQRFGFPFILAVRGPRGTGLSRAEIIASFARRLKNPLAVERDECLRNIHRIAEIRLNEKFGVVPMEGNRIWDWAADLARHSEEPDRLTVTYLTPAHRRCAAELATWMREACGFDAVHIDAVGNVVGVYHGLDDALPRLLTGSHYDTVRNAGRFDGRLGILVPMACVRRLHRAGKRLPFGIEVVGFAEEEGQRYKATFLGSSALVGQFDPAWLDQTDANGVPLRDAMMQAGLSLSDIAACTRDPRRYLGFVEVHIEQGPVLYETDTPLGVVTAINGSARYVGAFTGVACHAGTTPMDRRRDAAAAAAELTLFVEQRAAQDPNAVGTIGVLEVPGGSINVVPGQCRFTLDLRAPTNAQRDALAADVTREAKAIADRRGLDLQLELSMLASAAPCDATLRGQWACAVGALGLPVRLLSSGAGHDAMKLHERMPQAMLFVRGLNGGISHNPLESSTNDDIELSVRAFEQLLLQLANEGSARHD